MAVVLVGENTASVTYDMVAALMICPQELNV
jgi:hypothetical protein